MDWFTSVPKKVEITSKDYCKEQALHNLKLAKSIYKTTGFDDWVITCCYYASIYFVDMILFDKNCLKLNNIEIFSKTNLPFRINILQNTVKTDSKFACIPKEKHALRERIVAENFPEIKPIYSTIYNIGCKARYNYYKGYSSADAHAAYNDLAFKICKWAGLDTEVENID